MKHAELANFNTVTNERERESLVDMNFSKPHFGAAACEEILINISTGMKGEHEVSLMLSLSNKECSKEGKL